MSQTALQKTDFTYKLPNALIAQSPIEPRDTSKLLILNRENGKITHSNFRVLPSILQKGDILVRNSSKVIKARLFGYKVPTGGRIEILLNKLMESSTDQSIWECVVKPGISVGQQLEFGNEKLTAVCMGMSEDGYTRIIDFRVPLREFYARIDEIGETPLPPYIEKKTEKDITEKQYQTAYAREPGSVAAPTAGLHFTPQLDAVLAEKGISIVDVTLHVGLGTFLPVKSKSIADHVMHAEQFTLNDKTAQFLNEAKRAGRRIIAVGTTTCRVLETCAEITIDGSVELKPQTADTAIFIYPPYRFKYIDGLITNFHLPESTLLMLISAFVSAPNTSHTFTSFAQSTVGKAYKEAITNDYRFFSFGDAMIIV